MTEHIPEFLRKQALGKGDAAKEDAGPYLGAEQLPEYLGGKSKSKDDIEEMKDLLFKAGISPGTEVDTSDIRTPFTRRKKVLEKMQAEMDALARPKEPSDAEFSAHEDLLTEHIPEFLRKQALGKGDAAKEDAGPYLGAEQLPEYLGGKSKKVTEEIGVTKNASAEQKDGTAGRIKEIRQRLATLEREAASPADYPHNHDELENEVLTLEEELRGLESASRPVSEKRSSAEKQAPQTESLSRPAQEKQEKEQGEEGSWIPTPLEEQRSAILGELYGLYRRDANGPMEFDAIPEEVHQKFLDFFDTRAKNLSPDETIPEAEVAAFLAEQRAAAGAAEAGTSFQEPADETSSAKDERPIIPDPDDALDPKHAWAMRRAGLAEKKKSESENDLESAVTASERTPAESRSFLREIIGRFTEREKRAAAARTYFSEWNKELEKEAKKLNAPRWKGKTIIVVLLAGLGAYETASLLDVPATDAWLSRMLGHHGAPVTATQEASPAAAVAAREKAVPPKSFTMPTVEATRGRGYEYMLKQFWERLQTRYFDPSVYAQDSDIRVLLDADAHSIDKVVHRIAADPKHGFSRADGTSVLIDPGARMTIGAHGEIILSNPGQGIRHTPALARPVPRPKPPMSRRSEAPAAHPEVPTSFVNKNNLLIDPAHEHIFQDADGALLAYGGTYDAQFNVAQEYVQAHHDAVVWVQAEKPISYKGEEKPWVFPVRYGGALRGVYALIPVGPPDPSHIGNIDSEAFVKQLR